MDFKIYYGGTEQPRDAMRVPVGLEYRHVVSAYNGNKLAYMIRNPGDVLLSLSSGNRTWTVPYDCTVFLLAWIYGSDAGARCTITRNGIGLGYGVTTYANSKHADFNCRPWRLKRGDVIKASARKGHVIIYFLGDIEAKVFTDGKEIDNYNRVTVGSIRGDGVWSWSSKTDQFEVKTKYDEHVVYIGKTNKGYATFTP